MDYRIYCMEREELEELVQKMRKLRNMTLFPDSLKVLAIKSVCKNSHYFLNKNCGLGNLPSTIIQDFLSAIHEAQMNGENRHLLVPRETTLNFVLKLITPNVTKFDCSHFRMEDYFFLVSHLINNCPNITHVNMRLLAMRSCELPEVPCLKLSLWKSLRHLNVQGYSCNDETMGLIQKHLALLEELGLSISMESFTMDGVQHLSKMEHLVYLKIYDCTTRKQLDQLKPNFLALDVIVHCAGKAPALQKFYYSARTREDYAGFVKNYGQSYPDKKLVVDHFSLHKLEKAWPPCLAVKDLTLNGEFTPEAIAQLSTMPCTVEKIVLVNLTASKVHTLIDKLGPEITELRLQCHVRHPGDKLNIYRVLAACPKMEEVSLHLNSGLLLAGNPKFNLAPSHFKKCKRFFFKKLANNGSQAQLLEIYKLFLIGSESKSEITVSSYQITTLLEVMRHFPNCFKNMKKIELLLSQPDHAERFDDCLEIIKILTMNSPYLQKVELINMSGAIFCMESEIKEIFKRFGVQYVMVDLTRRDAWEDSDFSDFEDFDSDGD